MLFSEFFGGNIDGSPPNFVERIVGSQITKSSLLCHVSLLRKKCYSSKFNMLFSEGPEERGGSCNRVLLCLYRKGADHNRRRVFALRLCGSEYIYLYFFSQQKTLIVISRKPRKKCHLTSHTFLLHRDL